MGMDGLSIANTGAVKESTSAELTNRTEQAIQTDAANTGRQVQGLSVNQRVRPKEDDERSNPKKHDDKSNAQTDDTFEDGLAEDNTIEDNPDSDIENIENPNKDFYVKLNVKDDIIELYDSSTNRLIETISGNELGELVQKLNMASGIFINKKV